MRTDASFSKQAARPTAVGLSNQLAPQRWVCQTLLVAVSDCGRVGRCRRWLSVVDPYPSAPGCRKGRDACARGSPPNRWVARAMAGRWRCIASWNGTSAQITARISNRHANNARWNQRTAIHQGHQGCQTLEAQLTCRHEWMAAVI